MLKTLHMQSHLTEVMKYGPKLNAIEKCIKVTYSLINSFSLRVHMSSLCNASFVSQMKKLAPPSCAIRRNAKRSIRDAVYAKCQLKDSTSGAKGAVMVGTMTTYLSGSRTKDSVLQGAVINAETCYSSLRSE
jgi:hypothetical protein